MCGEGSVKYFQIENVEQHTSKHAQEMSKFLKGCHFESKNCSLHDYTNGNYASTTVSLLADKFSLNL